MKKFRIEVLGRSYVVASDKGEKFVAALERRVNDDISGLRARMPSADHLDLFVTYILHLLEHEAESSVHVEKRGKQDEIIRKKLGYLRRRIEEEMKGEI